MIKKEIILRADPEIVWQYITSRSHLEELWNSKVDYSLESGGDISLVDLGESVKIKTIEAPKKLTLQGGYGSLPISTTYTLTERKNGTSLKITVSGWEKIEQDEARRLVPALSLQWEKRLVRIKKEIEPGKGAAEKIGEKKR